MEKRKKNILFIRSTPSASPLLRKQWRSSIALIALFSACLLVSLGGLWQTAKDFNVARATNINPAEHPTLWPFIGCLGVAVGLFFAIKWRCEKLREEKYGSNDHLMIDLNSRECTHHMSSRDGYTVRITPFEKLTGITIGDVVHNGPDSYCGEITLHAETRYEGKSPQTTSWRLAYCDDVFQIPEALNSILRLKNLEEVTVEQNVA